MSTRHLFRVLILFKPTGVKITVSQGRRTYTRQLKVVKLYEYCAIQELAACEELGSLLGPPKSLCNNEVFLFVRLNKIYFQELHPEPFLLGMKTHQKFVNVV